MAAFKAFDLIGFSSTGGGLINWIPITNAPLPAAQPTSISVPLTCYEYAFFFKRVKQLTCSGIANGNAFSFTMDAQSNVPDFLIDELDAHTRGQDFSGAAGFDSGNYVASVAVLSNGSVLILPNAGGPPEDGGTLYYCQITLSLHKIVSDEFQDSVYSGYPSASGIPTGNPSLTSAYSIALIGTDLIPGAAGTISIPIHTVYSNAFPDISGSMTIAPSGFWPFEGAYDPTTGAPS